MRTLLVFLCAAAAGCSGEGRTYTVDPDRAREALRTALDAWKGGKAPDSLRQGSPEIVAVDKDWGKGAVLVDYKVVDEGHVMDANLRVGVELTLRDAGGKERKRSVHYVITTRPAVTVFRDTGL